MTLQNNPTLFHCHLKNFVNFLQLTFKEINLAFLVFKKHSITQELYTLHLIIHSIFIINFEIFIVLFIPLLTNIKYCLLFIHPPKLFSIKFKSIFYVLH